MVNQEQTPVRKLFAQMDSSLEMRLFAERLGVAKRGFFLDAAYKFLDATDVNGGRPGLSIVSSGVDGWAVLRRFGRRLSIAERGIFFHRRQLDGDTVRPGFL